MHVTFNRWPDRLNVHELQAKINVTSFHFSDFFPKFNFHFIIRFMAIRFLWFCFSWLICCFQVDLVTALVSYLIVFVGLSVVVLCEFSVLLRISAAAYVRNCLPTTTLKERETPYKRWYGRKPDVSHFRVFGCIMAYAHVPDCEQRKLDTKSKKMRFVGYSLTSKGYCLFDETNRKLYIRRDVEFRPCDSQPWLQSQTQRAWRWSRILTPLQKTKKK